jgi:hypothetical protein
MPVMQILYLMLVFGVPLVFVPSLAGVLVLAVRRLKRRKQGERSAEGVVGMLVFGGVCMVCLVLYLPFAWVVMLGGE